MHHSDSPPSEQLAFIASRPKGKPIMAPLLVLLEKAHLNLVHADQHSVGPDNYCRIVVQGEALQSFAIRLDELHNSTDYTIQLVNKQPPQIAWVWDGDPGSLQRLLQKYPSSGQHSMHSRFLVSANPKIIALAEAAAVPAFERQALVEAETDKASLDLVLQRYKPDVICEVSATTATSYHWNYSAAWQLRVPSPFSVQNQSSDRESTLLSNPWLCLQMVLATQHRDYIIAQNCASVPNTNDERCLSSLQANIVIQGLDKIANNRIMRHHHTVVAF